MSKKMMRQAKVKKSECTWYAVEAFASALLVLQSHRAMTEAVADAFYRAPKELSYDEIVGVVQGFAPSGELCGCDELMAKKKVGLQITPGGQ